MLKEISRRHFLAQAAGTGVLVTGGVSISSGVIPGAVSIAEPDGHIVPNNVAMRYVFASDSRAGRPGYATLPG